MLISRTLQVSINCAVDGVYRFVHDPRNLPEWAKAFCKAVNRIDGAWVMGTPRGPATIRFIADNQLGVLDHWVIPAPGVEVYVPMRVVANGNGATLTFTLFQHPEMSDEHFAADIAMVEQDLLGLKIALEARQQA